MTRLKSQHNKYWKVDADQDYKHRTWWRDQKGKYDGYSSLTQDYGS